jgi:hypothetical protein
MALSNPTQRRSQKAVTEDPNVILRIGRNRPFTSNKQLFSTTLEKESPSGGTLSMTKGWRVVERKFGNEKEMKEACKVAPLNIEVSRSKPNIVIRKQDGVSEKVLNELVDFLRDIPSLLIDRNNRDQYDPFLDQAVGTNASAEWFFEDMRTARKQKVSVNEDTIQIGAKIHEMKGNATKLRDALFLIGEAPSKEDELEDLYFMLSNKVIDDPKSKSRQLFIKYFINPDMSDKEVDILKWLNKGLSFGVIEQRGGFLVYGSERLGVSEREAIEHLGFSADIFKSIKVAVSNKSGMKEDIEVANKVVEAVGSTADISRAIAHVSDMLKSKGLSSRPDLILKKIDNLEDAVAKYNEKVKEADLPKTEFITVDGILAEIGA